VTLGLAQRATASGARIFQVLDREPRIEQAPEPMPLPPGNGHVQLRGVTLRYDETDDFGATYSAPREGSGLDAAIAAADGHGEHPAQGDHAANGASTNGSARQSRAALTGIDLDVPAGTTVALVGGTGSGKTSLVSLISRLYDTSEGHVLLDGADVRDVEVRPLRRAVSIVSDDPFLFSATVAENIAYGRPEASREEIEAAARKAQAHGFVSELPQGYETRVGERGLSLSGGQRQRIAIARALLMDPRVLILDDATASVDATTEAKIKVALREVMAGRTTLIIAHRLSTISLADHVVVLDRGRIAARGEHASLLAESPVYQEIYRHGLVERTFVRLDPDGAPIEKEDVA
jgi:ATP-binding cassette subfamily B protein